MSTYSYSPVGEDFRNFSTPNSKFKLLSLDCCLNEGKVDVPGCAFQLTIIVTAVFTLIVALKFLGLTKRTKKDSYKKNGDGSQIMKTVKDIPRLNHYKFWVPTFVEGLTSVLYFRNEGVRVVERWVREYGPMFEIAVLTGKVVAVQDPSMIQKILGSPDIHVLNKPRDLYNPVFRDWFRDGLIAVEVETWAPHRKMVARTVTYKILPTYLKMMNKHSKTLVSKFIAGSSNGKMEGQELHDILYSHSIKIISEIIFGSDSDSLNESDDLHHHFRGWKMQLVYAALNPHNLIPFIWWFNPRKQVYDNHVAVIMQYFEKDIERRRKMNDEVKKGQQRKQNGLNDCDEETKEGQDSKESSDSLGIKTFRSLIEEMVHCNASPKEIVDEAGTFLSAGHDTTVNAMNFFLQHMAEYPDIQAKCQEEIDGLFRSKPLLTDESGEEDSNYLSMDDLSNLKYLERCIMETLRITPTVPLIFRRLSAPMQFGDYQFSKGTTFAFLSWVVHRDPESYPDPERFDPDRFLPENMKKRNPFSFIAFSHGPRNCLGWKLAIMELKVVLAWILRHFSVYTEDKLHDVKIGFEITLLPERNYRIMLKQRDHR